MPITPIYEVQGTGLWSELDGQVVTVQGVVTGGQTMNPSTEEFVVAVEKMNAEMKRLAANPEVRKIIS
mgnify:CR=1 FL=1